MWKPGQKQLQTSDAKPVKGTVLSWKWKLSHKGIVLVSVLLVCELVFLGALAGLLNQAEAIAKKAEHSRQIIASVDKLLKSLVDSATAVAGYRLTRNPLMAARYNQMVEQVPADIERLKKLTAGNKDQQRCLAKLTRLANRWLEILTNVRSAVDYGGKLYLTINPETLQSEIEFLSGQVADELKVVAQEEKLESGRWPRRYEEARKEVFGFLIFGVVFNIVFAYLIAHWYIKGITDRLAVLSENTQRLTKHQPLHQQLTGTDEIAKLDQVFHAMSAELAEADRLKREFTSMVSHDLRTPLTSLAITINLLEDGILGPLTPEGKKVVATGGRQIDRLIALVNGLLEVEKLNSGKLGLKLGPASSGQIVEQAVESVRGLADKQKVSIKADSESYDFIADSNRLIQVLVNLLSNAIKFSPADSVVTIEVTGDPDWLEFRIKDQGRGIPPQFHQSVFDRFVQVKHSDSTKKGGTGLGLPICKGIVTEHGGTIGVESEVGKGSCFWLRLPRQHKDEGLPSGIGQPLAGGEIAEA